jgi:hypothetical protein
VRRFVLGAFLAPAVLFCLWSVAAAQAPAVSGINGKIEFDAGLLTLPTPGFVTRAAGTLTLPVGSGFGLQADFSVATAPSFTAGGALHLFARDPQSYLIGGTLGFVRTPGALVLAAGPEAELYFERWTIEAWGGVSHSRPMAGPSRVLPFVMADVAAYITDNWRLSVGVSSLDGYNAVHAGSEYLLEDFALPVSLTADARLGQDGAILATVGLRAYLGGPPKSLVRRHREDDPADRSSSLYTAVGGSTVGGGGTTPPAGGPATPPVDPPDAAPPAAPPPPPAEPPRRNSDRPRPHPEPPANHGGGGDDDDEDHHSPPDTPDPPMDEPCENPLDFARDPITGECVPFV